MLEKRIKRTKGAFFFPSHFLKLEVTSDAVPCLLIEGITPHTKSSDNRGQMKDTVRREGDRPEQLTGDFLNPESLPESESPARLSQQRLHAKIVTSFSS